MLRPWRWRRAGTLVATLAASIAIYVVLSGKPVAVEGKLPLAQATVPKVTTAKYHDSHYPTDLPQFDAPGFFSTLASSDSAIWYLPRQNNSYVISNMLFSSKCIHCRHFRPSIWYVFNRTQGWSKSVPFRMGIVDCIKERELCEQVGVVEYPTVRLYYKKSKEFDIYRGLLADEPFMSWVCNQTRIRANEIFIDAPEHLANCPDYTTKKEPAPPPEKVPSNTIIKETEDGKVANLLSQIYKVWNDPDAVGKLVPFGPKELELLLFSKKKAKQRQKGNSHFIWLLVIVHEETPFKRQLDDIEVAAEHFAQRLAGKIRVSIVNANNVIGRTVLGSTGYCNKFKTGPRNILVGIVAANTVGQRAWYHGPWTEQEVLGWVRGVTRADVIDTEDANTRMADDKDIDVKIKITGSFATMESVMHVAEAMSVFLHPPSLRIYITNNLSPTKVSVSRRGVLETPEIEVGSSPTEINKLVRFLDRRRFAAVPEVDEVTAHDLLGEFSCASRLDHLRIPRNAKFTVTVLAVLDTHALVDEIEQLEMLAREFELRKLESGAVRVRWINGVRWSSYLRAAFNATEVPQNGLPFGIILLGIEIKGYRKIHKRVRVYKDWRNPKTGLLRKLEVSYADLARAVQRVLKSADEYVTEVNLGYEKEKEKKPVAVDGAYDYKVSVQQETFLQDALLTENSVPGTTLENEYEEQDYDEEGEEEQESAEGYTNTMDDAYSSINEELDANLKMEKEDDLVLLRHGTIANPPRPVVRSAFGITAHTAALLSLGFGAAAAVIFSLKQLSRCRRQRAALYAKLQ